MPRAFTLIELMVVVAIVGLLAALAVPNYVKFQCRAKQSEVKNNLKAIFTAEQTFRSEFDSYKLVPAIGATASGTNEIGFSPKGGRIRYTYQVTTADSVSFDAEGSAVAGAISAGIDTWTITELNDTTATVNACD
jgi:type IV pilus assembly protein PilA